MVWGLLELATGYIFGLVAIVIGLFVAWAISKGAGAVSIGVIGLAALLTLLAIFMGQLLALSIVAAEFGVGPLQVLALYPRIVAAEPGVLLDYVFAVFGVFASARYLWRQRTVAVPRSTIPPLGPPRAPGIATPTASVFPPGAPQVRVLERGFARLAVEIQVPTDRPHTVRATYSTMNGMAEVFLDGSPFKSTRVWGLSKEIPVRLDGTGTTRVLSLRFHGVGGPHIEIHLDGSPLADL